MKMKMKMKVTLSPFQVFALQAIINFERKGELCPIVENYLSSLSKKNREGADTGKAAKAE